MTEYFIKNLIFFALTIVSALAFKLVIAKTKFRGKGNEGNVLRFPLGYRLAPFVFMAYFGVVTLLVLLFADGDIIYIIVAAIVALCALLLALGLSLWKVEIGEEQFLYRNYFGIKTVYRYQFLRLIVHKSGMKWMFFSGQKKVLSLPRFVRNGDRLIEQYEKFFQRQR